MALYQKIKDSIEAIGENLAYGTAKELNNLLKEVPMPGVFMNLLVDTEQVQVSAQTVEQGNVFIFFIALTNWDFWAPENELIIVECQDRADRWLRSLKNSPTLKKVNAAKYKRIYLQYDGQFTGIGINVIIRENSGKTYCNIT